MKKILAQIVFPIGGTYLIGTFAELSDGESCIILILLFIIAAMDELRETR